MQKDSREWYYGQDHWQALQPYLVSKGYQVIVANNGKEGLEVALREKPDLILLDQLMPVMSGTEMLQELRNHPDGMELEVIMMTNMNDVPTINKALAGGAVDYVVKSDTNMSEILKVISDRFAE